MKWPWVSRKRLQVCERERERAHADYLHAKREATCSKCASPEGELRVVHAGSYAVRLYRVCSNCGNRQRLMFSQDFAPERKGKSR